MIKESTRFRGSIVGIAIVFAAIYWLFFACVAQGASNQISLTLTVTNVPNGLDTLTVNGSVRTWTNAVYTPATQIRLTNSVGWTATNLFVQLSAYGVPGPVPVAWQTNTSNTLILVAAPDAALTFSVSGTWASGLLSTQALVAATVVRVPITVESAQRRTNIASGLIEAMTYSSNQFSAGVKAMTEFMARTNGYGTNQVLDKPTLTNAVNRGLAFSSPGTNGTASEQFGVGALANQDYSTALGSFSVATNSYATAIGSYAVASGGESVALGRAATASGPFSIAIGDGTVADKHSSIAIGSGSESTHSNSIVIGTSVNSIRTNEIRLGGSQDVVIGGLLLVEGIFSNSAIRVSGGTLTNVSGSFSSLTSTSLVGHAAFLTNVLMEAASVDATNLNARSATITNATLSVKNATLTNFNALAGTLTNVSGAFSGLTATQANLLSATITNAEIAVNNATLTNFTAYAGTLSNVNLSAPKLTNGIARLRLTIGGALAIAPYALGSLANSNNAAIAIATNSVVSISSGPSAAFNICGIDSTGVSDGQELELYNFTGYNMVIEHESGVDPVAANRIITATGALKETSGNGWAFFRYMGSQSRWILKGLEP